MTVAKMGKDVLSAIDSSTTASKAIAWERDGAMAGLGAQSHTLASPANQWYEQEPEDW